jgi:penicillin-binding protein 1A
LKKRKKKLKNKKTPSLRGGLFKIFSFLNIIFVKMKHKYIKRGVLIFIKFFVFAFLFGFISVFSLFLYYGKDLPRPEVFLEMEVPQSTKIYDRTGKILLYEIYGEEKRTYVPLSQIPKHLKDAVICVEDSNFYHHFGVDPKAIVRAILSDLKIFKPAYGASTISQQLIRSTFLSLEKTPERKTREIVLAIELDRKYSKDQILEWYLNQIPFGQNAYGVEAAAQTYFGKHVGEIDLAESAILASLIRGPYLYSPYNENSKEKLLARKDYVLDKMVREGFISKEEAEEAKRKEIVFKEKKGEILAPYFTLWVKEILEKEYGNEFLATAGWKVYTSLDFEVQKIAEEVVREGIKRNKQYNAHNAALVAISPKTGEVLAMTVGTGNYYEEPYPEGCTPGVNCLFDPKFNVAVGTEKSPGRQPGSAFKPFIYATAFKKGYDDKFLVLDSPTSFGVWGGKEYTPQNFDGRFRGWVTLRSALAQSLNIPSIKVLYLAGLNGKIESLGISDFRGLEGILLEGLKESLKTAKDLGITTLNKDISNYGPSIVLGGGEVKPLEMAYAYSVFANQGVKTSLSPILKIEDSNGKIIFEKKNLQIRVLDKEVAKLITDILSDNEARAPMFGLRSHLYFENYKVAVKTGTTDNFKDCWTVGYTPEISVSVWTGNSNNAPMIKRQPAATVAGPIFHSFLEKVLPKISSSTTQPIE